MSVEKILEQFQEDWQKEWVKCIFGGVYNEATKKHLQKPIPDKLYQYKKISRDTLEQIKNQQIHFSSAPTFNDPFDFLIQEPAVLNAIQAKTGKTALDEQVAEGAMALNKQRNNVFISCLSEQNSNLPMWAHYADTGKGVCIEFDMSKNNNDIAPHPVFYTDRISTIFENLVEYNTESPSEHSFCLFEKALSILALCKHPSWAYEEEWRFITFFQNVVFKNSKRALPISAVYFGLNTENSSQEMIKTIVKGKGIALYQMKVSSKKHFSLEAIPICD